MSSHASSATQSSGPGSQSGGSSSCISCCYCDGPGLVIDDGALLIENGALVICGEY
jgi:hypothetical protein